MGYPIAPLVIGVILGPMADENLRRALMVSQGSFMPVFTRPVSLILFIIIVWTIVSQFQWFRKYKDRDLGAVLPGDACESHTRGGTMNRTFTVPGASDSKRHDGRRLTKPVAKEEDHA
jgi:hypothetical protein